LARFAFLGRDVVALRSNITDAFYFLAYRSFVAAQVFRVVLSTAAFVMAFSTLASA
jgi:hypothetical protein